ncbi:MAG TPA: GNAT family N-acetyltransferase [Trebonia sp.]
MGGGAAFSVRDDSSRFWTKALGFGFAEPVTGDLIGRLTDFYRDQGAPSASIQLAPPVIPADWDAICAKENLSAGAKLAKLACEPEAVLANVRTDLDQGLRAEAVTSARRTEYSTAMARVFGMEDEYPTAILAATVDRPGWHAYAVYAGDRIVATASVYANGDTAQMFGGSTLPEYRGRGAQTALIAARARAARDAGCRWLVAETGTEKPGEHNPSLWNLRRAGFEVLYERTNWTWRPAGTPPR